MFLGALFEVAKGLALGFGEVYAPGRALLWAADEIAVNSVPESLRPFVTEHGDFVVVLWDESSGWGFLADTDPRGNGQLPNLRELTVLLTDREVGIFRRLSADESEAARAEQRRLVRLGLQRLRDYRELNQ